MSNLPYGFSSFQKEGNMLATMTVRDMRSELRKMGFFHATGLPVFNAQNDDEYYTIQARCDELGSWGCNGVWIIVVLETGEVWLRACAKEPLLDRNTLKRLCPKRRRAQVPLSSLDIIHLRWLRQPRSSTALIKHKNPLNIKPCFANAEQGCFIF